MTTTGARDGCFAKCFLATLLFLMSLHSPVTEAASRRTEWKVHDVRNEQRGTAEGKTAPALLDLKPQSCWLRLPKSGGGAKGVTESN